MEKDIALGSIGSFDVSYSGGKASAKLSFSINGGLSGSVCISEDVSGSLIPFLAGLISKAAPAIAPEVQVIEPIVANAAASLS